MYELVEFSLDLTKNTSPQEHIWVNSGCNTVSRIESTVMGVKGCYSPPISAGDIELMISVLANNHEIMDTGRLGKMKGDCGFLLSKDIWRPDYLYREGTYHYFVDEYLMSFKVTSKLIPLSDEVGFLLQLNLTNRSNENVDVQVIPKLDVGCPYILPLDSWDFAKPSKGKSKAMKTKEDCWENDEVVVNLINSNLCSNLEKNESKDFLVAVTLKERINDKKHNINITINNQNLEEWKVNTTRKWELRLNKMLDGVPRLNTNIKKLENYYKRSLISGLITIWDKKEFSLNPFPAVSGINGMGI